jgi:ABC-2 type transport system permease protein
MAPIFYSLFYGTIYINKVEREIPVVVYDEDHTETSKTLIRKLDAHQMIQVAETVPDFQSGVNRINSGDAQAMIYFPKGFEADLKLHRNVTLKSYLNTTRFLVSNDINMAVNETIIDYNTAIKLKFFQQAGYSYQQAKELTEPIKYDVRSLFNFTESYGEFLIPGIFILIIQQTLLIGLAESMAKEKESGTLGDLFGISGSSIFKLIHGKGLFYTILYSAYAFFFFTFNYWLFKMDITGSFFALALFTLLMIVSAVYLAIFIASFFERKIVAVQFLTLTTYPVFFISGYSWPLASMPVFIQYLAKILPSTPFLSAFVRITKMGAGLSETMPEFIHLIILTIIFYILTHLRLKSFIKKQLTTTEV